MITLDDTKLERVLLEVFEKEYGHNNSNYLVVESIEFDLDDEYPKLYVVKGRYGVENSWQRQFDLTLDRDWNWDFIAGYFCRQIYLDDEEQQYETNN